MRAQAVKITKPGSASKSKRNASDSVRASSGNGLSFGPVFLGVFCCSFILLAAANLQEINNYVNRPVNVVKLESQWSKLAESEVNRLLLPYMGAGFFAFDVQGLKKDLESHPWVQRVSVKRVWPDSVALEIREKVAIARWGDAQLLSQSGEKFFPPEFGDAVNLPLLRGPADSQAKVMQQFQFLNELFSPVDLRLSELTLSERGSWEVVVDERIAIAAGREKIVERVNRFIAFYQKLPTYERESISAVDLRYDNGLALARDSSELSGVAVR